MIGCLKCDKACDWLVRAVIIIYETRWRNLTDSAHFSQNVVGSSVAVFTWIYLALF